jgi:hypothetical protein
MTLSPYTYQMIRSTALHQNNTKEAEAKGPDLSESAVCLLVAIVFVIYAARLFRLISRYAVNIFFADQWDFNNATLFERHSLWQIFRWQHGPHRQGAGGLFERLVDPLFGWNSRTESFVVAGLIIAAAMFALWLKRRLYGKLSVFDIVIPAILFTPAQWHTLFMGQNFAHGSFPLLLILLYCLSWTSRRQYVRYPLVLFINFVTIYTGFGIFLGVLTPALLILDYLSGTSERRLSRGYLITAILVSLCSLASFFAGYKFQPAIACFSLQPASPVSYWNFVALMFANFFAVRRLSLGTELFGTLILAAVLACLVFVVACLMRKEKPKLAPDERNRALIIVTLTAFTLLFCANTAYGRLCGGLATALQSRYAIYLEPAVLGLYFFLLSIRPGRARAFLLGGFLALIMAASLYVDRRGMNFAWYVREHWKTCYLQTENIDGCNRAASFPIYPNPEKNHLKRKLEYLKRTGQNLYLDQEVQ